MPEPLESAFARHEEERRQESEAKMQLEGRRLDETRKNNERFAKAARLIKSQIRRLQFYSIVYYDEPGIFERLFLGKTTVPTGRGTNEAEIVEVNEAHVKSLTVRYVYIDNTHRKRVGNAYKHFTLSANDVARHSWTAAEIAEEFFKTVLSSPDCEMKK